MFEHPHALTCWPTVRVDRNTLEMVYVIETDLAISPDDPDYDEGAFTGFVEAIRGYLAANLHYNSAQVNEFRRNKDA
jgi:hypothetical protein